MNPLPWQARFLRGLARPNVRTAALAVARSNGKSWLAGRLAADYLLGGGAEHSECVIVASSYTQAKIIFRYAVRMVRDAGHDPDERKAWHYRDGANVALLRNREDGRAIRAIGSDPRRAHGRVFGCFLWDEPAQFPPGQAEAMLAAVRTGAGKVRRTKIVALGTRPAGAGHWFAEWLAGGADYVQCHAARPDDPPYQLRTIRRANPSYDYLPALREDLLSQRIEARADPVARARYEALALNRGTPDTAVRVLIDAEVWERIEGDALPTGPCVWGVDLALGESMAAVACYWPDTGRLEALAAFSGDRSLTERARRDGAGRAYARAAEDGRLIQLGHRTVPIDLLLREALRRFGVPAALAGDRQRARELLDAMDAVGLGGVAWVKRGAGFLSAGEDIRDFRRACLEDRVTPVPSVLLRHCLSVARLAGPDDAGNWKLARKAESGRRSRSRDDAIAAAILAVAEGSRRRATLGRPSWRSLGVIG